MTAVLLLLIPSLSMAQAPTEVLEVSGFGGQMVDTMDGNDHSGFSGGVAATYHLGSRFHLNINTYHSKRNAEKVSEEGGISDLLLTSDAFEWGAGVGFDIFKLNQGQTAVSVVGQGGFVQLRGEPGDVLDDHFVGLEVSHAGGVFEGSRFRLGYGKSDVFLENRNGRFKSSAHLAYQPGNLPLGVGAFINASLDSDLRDGRDGTRVLMGAFVPVEELFQ